MFKYKVGDRIKNICDEYLKTTHCCGTDDIGLTGTVVEVGEKTVKVYLPESTHNNSFFNTNKDYTWDTQPHRIELLVKVGQQLLFKFMKG